MPKTVSVRALPVGIEFTFSAIEEGENGSYASVATQDRRCTTWYCKAGPHAQQQEDQRREGRRGCYRSRLH